MEEYRKCPDMRQDSVIRFDMERFPVAMGYVPWQHWHTVYGLEKGLKCGTIFPELNKPFMGVRGGCK